MGNRGRNKYVPQVVLEKINLIKLKEKFGGKRGDTKAFLKLNNYAEIGMEFERIRNRFILSDIWGKKRK